MDPGEINRKDMKADLQSTLRENSGAATMVVFDVQVAGKLKSL
jgi:hypothetical protein